jgi:hypothetical protein
MLLFQFFIESLYEIGYQIYHYLQLFANHIEQI